MLGTSASVRHEPAGPKDSYTAGDGEKRDAETLGPRTVISRAGLDAWSAVGTGYSRGSGISVSADQARTVVLDGDPRFHQQRCRRVRLDGVDPVFDPLAVYITPDDQALTLTARPSTTTAVTPP